MSDVRTLPSLDELAAHPERAVGLSGDVILALHVRAVRVVMALEGPLLAAVNRKQPDSEPIGPNLTASEAAAYLRIKKSRLDWLRRNGLVPATKLGKAFTYRLADLESLGEGIR